MRETRRSLARLCALVILLGASWGCLNYKEVIKIQTDGSGTVEIDATIPEYQAARFRTGAYTGTTPAPVREGVIKQWMSGSTGAHVTDLQVELANEIWTYRVVLEFDSLKSLSRVKYFKGRNLSLSFASAKEMRFRQDIKPTLLQMAKDQATLLTDDVYAAEFLTRAETTEFKALLAESKLTYRVILPGTGATYTGTWAIEPNDTISATKDFTMADTVDENSKQSMDVLVTLPAERGFTPVVVLLLLASLAGILVTSIRLLVLRLRGVG